MNPEDVFGKDYEPFCEVDPFNSTNEVCGFISRKATEYYGALLINQVNKQNVKEQLIMATPKMHYPFDSREDGSRHYKFPIADNVEIYEKLDGTNVLSYKYSDGEQDFISYKTRLRPFLSSGRFGDFLTMWHEVADKYADEIEYVMDFNDCNLSFELFGNRNPHLIYYPNMLDIALLFGVNNTGRILSPEKIKGVDNLPIVKKFATIDSDFVSRYESLQKELEATLKQQDDLYSGTEGTVWYLNLPEGKTIQVKCKPETVETIHFSAGKGALSRNTIIATCWNGFENVDVLTVEFIKKLLLEEFEERIVEANHYLIGECVKFVNEAAIFRNKVLAEYKSLGMNILLNKREVMRALSEKFDRNDMKKVYSIIVGYA